MLGAAGAALASAATPGGDLAALAVAVVAAASVRLDRRHLGRPARARRRAAPTSPSSASPSTRVEPAARQTAGVFVVRAEDAAGRPLLVKVYGRDAYDSQLLAKLWRTLWYQGAGPRLRLSRVQAVEHEALVTLLAAQAGVPTRTVVTAGEAAAGDALLVLHDRALRAPARARRRACSPRELERARAARRRRHRAPPDRSVDARARRRRAGLVDFDGATLSPRPDQLETDRAQLLATTAVLAGPERARRRGASPRSATTGVAALLPYLQAGAFGVPLRQALKAARRSTSTSCARPPPRPSAPRSPSSSACAASPGGRSSRSRCSRSRVWTVLAALGGLDYGQLRESLDGASWWWVAAGFVIAQLPRLTQAVSTLGSVPARLAFRPGLRDAARDRLHEPGAAVEPRAHGGQHPLLPAPGHPADRRRHRRRDRLLREHGDPGGDARAAAALLEREPEPRPRRAVGRLAAARGRRRASWWSRRSPRCCSCRACATRSSSACAAGGPRCAAPCSGCARSDKLGLLLGGSLATELLFATALGVFANALGYDVSLADLLVMNISVSLLGSFVPIPGNIGVAELGLTVGLVSAGMTEEAALAAVLLYRAATFYIPPVWGFFAMRWLQRNATCSRVAPMTWVLIVVLVAAGADRALAGPALQRARPEAQPGRQRLGADRRAAAAAARPDPEPRRDGEGLRGARARHVRGGHRRRAPRRRTRRTRPRPAPRKAC